MASMSPRSVRSSVFDQHSHLVAEPECPPDTHLLLRVDQRLVGGHLHLGRRRRLGCNSRLGLPHPLGHIGASRGFRRRPSFALSGRRPFAAEPVAARGLRVIGLIVGRLHESLVFDARGFPHGLVGCRPLDPLARIAHRVATLPAFRLRRILTGLG